MAAEVETDAVPPEQRVEPGDELWIVSVPARRVDYIHPTHITSRITYPIDSIYSTYTVHTVVESIAFTSIVSSYDEPRGIARSQLPFYQLKIGVHFRRRNVLCGLRRDTRSNERRVDK